MKSWTIFTSFCDKKNVNKILVFNISQKPFKIISYNANFYQALVWINNLLKCFQKYLIDFTIFLIFDKQFTVRKAARTNVVFIEYVLCPAYLNVYSVHSASSYIASRHGRHFKFNQKNITKKRIYTSWKTLLT